MHDAATELDYQKAGHWNGRATYSNGHGERCFLEAAESSWRKVSSRRALTVRWLISCSTERTYFSVSSVHPYAFALYRKMAQVFYTRWWHNLSPPSRSKRLSYKTDWKVFIWEWRVYRTYATFFLARFTCFLTKNDGTGNIVRFVRFPESSIQWLLTCSLLFSYVLRF